MSEQKLDEEPVELDSTKKKDVTHSVKTTNEVRDMYKELVKKTGLDSKDLFENMVRMYNASISEKAANIINTEEYKKCLYFTDRIKDLFISQYKSLNDEMLIQNEKNKEVIKQYNETVENLNKTIVELNDKIKSLEKQNNELADKAQKVSKNYDELNEKYNMLNKSVNIIQNNNDYLNNLVNEYKGYKDDYQKLDEKYKLLQEDLNKMQTEKDNIIKAKNDEIIKLNNSLREKDEEMNLVKAEIAQKYEAKIAEMKEFCRIDKEKALIELDKKHLGEIAQLLKNNR